MILDKELYQSKSPFKNLVGAFLGSIADLFKVAQKPRRYIEEAPVVKGMPARVEGAQCGECSLCVQMCPEMALSKSNTLILDVSRCISCQDCVELCPDNLLYASEVVSFVAHGEVSEMKLEL